MVVCEGAQFTAAGVVLGLVLSATATRLIASWLFTISPLDLRRRQ